jgi:DNA polymerase I-like protein with 3'-5' exonuclease and polymerase domains
VQTVKPRKDPKTGRKVYSKSPASTIDAFTAAVGASGRQDLKGAVSEYAKAEAAEAILKGFALPMLKMVRGGRVHPRFNPCGTKSYRLSGYKPSFMNLPFDHSELMACFSCDEGWTGVSADLISIEPAMTAHYSQDPSLLKIFVEGRGDVYLDLALTIFPLNDLDLYDEEVQAHILVLHHEYDSNAPVDEDVKSRHKLVRKVSKIVQLAVQYTGTEYTVSLNLTQAGFPTTLERAAEMVASYWRHFAKVAEMNVRLARLHERKGYLRNAVGRVVRKSRSDDKDLPNLFFQSSAHDFLSLWVLRIYELCVERGIEVRPVLVDCHDSSSNCCPDGQVEGLKQAYLDALADVNSRLGLSVPVRCEIKTFRTLAGLKGDDAMMVQEVA